MRITLLFLSFLVPCFLAGQIFLPLTDNGLYDQLNNSLSSSWADYDGDGFQDVFTSFGILFVSDNGTNFSPVEQGGLADFATGISATWGDYDHDGFPDLYIAQPQGINPIQGSKLFHNNGDGTFSLVMDEPFLSDTNDFQGASFIDIENDGDLDIYVAAGGNTGYRNNSLYINNGDGTFTKDTDSVLAQDSSGTVNAIWADYDLDGDSDVYLSNSPPSADSTLNRLYRNEGNGEFVLANSGPLSEDYAFTLGGSWGDYNNDGYQDLFVSDTDSTGFLYQNNGDGTFTSVDAAMTTFFGFASGSGWADFDNDGDLDLLVAGFEGHSNSLYQNNGDGTFTELVAEMSNEILNLGCTWADWDNDGDQDALYSWEGFLSPYENQGNDNNWLNIHCTGTVSNTTAIGTKVWLYATIAGEPVMQLREISGQSGVLGQSDMRAHFGLGDAAVVDSVRFEWPSGIVQVIENPPINQHMMVLEDTSVISSVQIIQSPVTSIEVFPNPTSEIVQVQFETSRSIEYRTQLFDLQGRELQSFPAKEILQGIHVETLDLSALAPGSYFIRLSTVGGLSFTKKVVVE